MTRAFPASHDEERWYIAITNPNCQRRAECELAALGYRSFCPKLRKWVSHARTKQAKEYPILGRYMFVEIPDGDYFTIRNVNGIEALLTDEQGEPEMIPAEVVHEFRARYLRGEWDFVVNETGLFECGGELVSRSNPIPVGALVRVMEGELMGQLAIVRGIKRKQVTLMLKGERRLHGTWLDNVRAA